MLCQKMKNKALVQRCIKICLKNNKKNKINQATYMCIDHTPGERHGYLRMIGESVIELWLSLWIQPTYKQQITLENQQHAYAKTKTQISCAVTAQLISVFVFATQIVQSLFFLNPEFQASSLLL